MNIQYKLEDFLNVRGSTRALNDEDFENAVDQLAQQLVCINYKFKYSDSELTKDWKSLKAYNNKDKDFNSTCRHGMRICEHFMDNFWEINNAKGKSFANQWTIENLKKVLRWNRKSHSTPYLSEIRRGIYFCTGLTKNTMFRPGLAKMIVDKYAPNGIVLDPCAGWGGRMLGSVASGAKYIAFEPNTRTYKNLLKIVNYLQIESEVQIYNDVAENIDKYNIHNVDLILTSPPYYNLEVYSDETTQSVKNGQSYDDWVAQFLKPVITKCIQTGKPTVCSAWNVDVCGKHNIPNDVNSIHYELKFVGKEIYSVSSSKRQANQNTSEKNQKRRDYTVCYVSA